MFSGILTIKDLRRSIRPHFVALSLPSAGVFFLSVKLLFRKEMYEQL
jgi:hypothetical protein